MSIIIKYRYNYNTLAFGASFMGYLKLCYWFLVLLSGAYHGYLKLCYWFLVLSSGAYHYYAFCDF